MKPFLLHAFFLGVTMTLPLFSQAKPPKNSATILAHVRNSFDLIVRLPYKRAATLFGPNGERSWAGDHWNPEFLYPQPGKDVRGAVFTIQHGTHKIVWVNSAFDLKGRHFQYVYFVQEIMVATIDVHFESLDANSTRVIVTYERTSLSPEANAAVEAMGKKDSASGPEWQRSIADYLARSKNDDRLRTRASK